jgi:hypothetical protein
MFRLSARPEMPALMLLAIQVRYRRLRAHQRELQRHHTRDRCQGPLRPQRTKEASHPAHHPVETLLRRWPGEQAGHPGDPRPDAQESGSTASWRRKGAELRRKQRPPSGARKVP